MSYARCPICRELTPGAMRGVGLVCRNGHAFTPKFYRRNLPPDYLRLCDCGEPGDQHGATGWTCAGCREKQGRYDSLARALVGFPYHALWPHEVPKELYEALT